MKLNEQIVELMLDLNALEGGNNAHLLIGEGRYLRNNLLKLYRTTENPRSHELIVDIMSAAGYQWFAKLVKTSTVEEKAESIAATRTANIEGNYVMSDDEFMELIPANGLFH